MFNTICHSRIIFFNHNLHVNITKYSIFINKKMSNYYVKVYFKIFSYKYLIDPLSNESTYYIILKVLVNNSFQIFSNVLIIYLKYYFTSSSKLLIYQLYLQMQNQS
jgi:hypothetical protein